ATGKLYRYRIVNRFTSLPFEARWTWHVSRPLDVGAMRTAAARLVGRRDFASYSASGGTAARTVRDLRRLEVVSRGGGVLEIDAVADGFLYKMVRILVGLLVEVGSGRRLASDVGGEGTDRRVRPPIRTAPPQGLCLVRVEYPERFGEI
ncbi:MAG: tRNA pseudouridine(38-40) synthase TruA, partial [Acidobacteriota bacterium]|nr:tRNA pseudouridine(38-40) synthase TruA [Acidobacteriota bacterium]